MANLFANSKFENFQKFPLLHGIAPKCFFFFCLILGQDDGVKLQQDLNKLFEWSHIWGMEFNVKKCKVLRVVHTKCIYDLGIIFLEELSWRVLLLKKIWVF